MFWLIETLIVGLIVGALAKLVMPGKDGGGILVTIVLGIAGAFVGTMIGRLTGLYAQNQAAGWIMSILGAVVLLLAFRRFRK